MVLKQFALMPPKSNKLGSGYILNPPLPSSPSPPYKKGARKFQCKKRLKSSMEKIRPKRNAQYIQTPQSMS